MTGPQPTRVTVAVPTFRRPFELNRLLSELRDQIIDAGPGVAVEVLVVDNDQAQSASAVVARCPWARYVAQPHPGLAAVRNEALRQTTDREVLVFIDDDESPTTGWLRRLLDTWRATDALGVAGPVRSVLPGDLDPWISAGGFFERRYRHGLPTGTEIPEAATNNLLLDLGAVRAHDLWFDPAFGLTGGEDSMFTRRLAQLGPLVWCAEAVVHDPVPSARLSRRWVCRRALSSANSAALVDLALHGPSPLRRARLAGRGLVRIGAGWGQALAGTLTRSTDWRARGTRATWRGYGLLLGGLGISYLEYGRGRRWRRTVRVSA